MQTFYRWHRATAPAFTADNAWSADWGSEFTHDGSSYACTACDGTGQSNDPRECTRCDGEGCHYCGDGMITECEDCDGEGSVDCERGYSCFEDPADLVTYIRERAGEPDDSWGSVVVFEGTTTGAGTDGEPLAIPTRIVETFTWSELVKRAETEESE